MQNATRKGMDQFKSMKSNLDETREGFWLASMWVVVLCVCVRVCADGEAIRSYCLVLFKSVS